MTREIHHRMRTSDVQLTEIVRAVIALELLVPGRVVYLAVPRLQNTTLFINDVGQFGAIMAERDSGILTLADILTLLTERGVSVRLIYTGDEAANEFVARLDGRIQARAALPLSYPGIFTEHGCILGAIGFGDGTVELQEQIIRVEHERPTVNRALLDIEQYWEELE